MTEPNPREEKFHLRRIGAAQLSKTNVLLMCERGHDHIVGTAQSHLERTLCPWCGTLLTLKARGWR